MPKREIKDIITGKSVCEASEEELNSLFWQVTGHSPKPGAVQVLQRECEKIPKAKEVEPKYKLDCCELVSIMEGTIEDEDESEKLYTDMAKQLLIFEGKDSTVNFFRDILDDMSKDEIKHKNYLKAMSTNLSDFCKCK